jgi:hypothetical protein
MPQVNRTGARREPTSETCWCRLDQPVRPAREGTGLLLLLELMFICGDMIGEKLSVQRVANA